MDKINKLLNVLIKDYIVVSICLLSLLACVYTIYTVVSYQTAINQAWQQQWDLSKCAISPNIPNINFSLWGVYHENKSLD